VGDSNFEVTNIVIFSSLLLLHPSWTQIFSSVPCSQLRQFMILRNVRDKISHLLKKIGKNTVLYILIFRFIDSRWEDKRFWTEWQKAFFEIHLLISSWMQFCFDTEDCIHPTSWFRLVCESILPSPPLKNIYTY
jgi:hypothetical protein